MKMEHTYGDGSVYQTADGRWVVKISLGTGPDGKPLTKRFSAKTKAAAEKKLRDFKKAQRQETKPAIVHYTLAAYLDFWMKTYQYQKLKPLSYDRLESTIRNHMPATTGNDSIMWLYQKSTTQKNPRLVRGGDGDAREISPGA